ncbi:hypothetical protein CCR75_007927 [Bremia lactucae]|uniref:PX domain-containing protein n=1 Tax=Bremia lactucae TaxID=4779 RepID=A0A976FI91_BRELC|nr:hypothetical protein CCR75_007927 [Bremia lactucae]
MTSPSHRDQLRILNNSLVRGSLSRQEFDELLPFVQSPSSIIYATRPQERQTIVVSSSPGRHYNQQRNVRFADDIDRSTSEPIHALSQYQMLASAVGASLISGLQLRCPMCGTSNDLACVSRCDVCNSRLTIAEELSTTTPRSESSTYSYSSVSPTRGSFSVAENGRTVIYNGYFSCTMHGTQAVMTADGSTCQVFVLCCTWQPKGLERQQTYATWYVSQRFSQFEKLHKALKKKLAHSSMLSLPPFPAKYYLKNRNSKRQQGLGMYMPRLLEMSTQIPNAQPVPELDEFLDIAHQVQIFQSRLISVADPPFVSATSSRDASLHFPVHRGSSMMSSQPLAPPMDATELAQAEGVVTLLADALCGAQGDVRGDATVQHRLSVCVKLALRLQRSVDLDNPFADAELVPRAMQCQEELQQVFAIYNDALLAALGLISTQQQARAIGQHEPHVQAQQRHERSIVPASAA